MLSRLLIGNIRVLVAFCASCIDIVLNLLLVAGIVASVFFLLKDSRFISRYNVLCSQTHLTHHSHTSNCTPPQPT